VDPVLRIPAPQNHGAQTELLVAAQPVRGPDGQPTGACIAVKDVTDRARLTEQVHQSRKMEAVGQLASGIAHDINNTLTAIDGYLSLALVALEKNHAATPCLDDPHTPDLRPAGAASPRACRTGSDHSASDVHGPRPYAGDHRCRSRYQ
jgi:signal transduction histidine kinase